MSRRFRIIACAIVFVFAPILSAQAYAQSDGVGLRAYVFSESLSMAAKESFDAVLGTSRLTFLGFGGEVTRIPRGVFIRAAATRPVTKTGDRVVVFNNEAVSVGIGVTVEMQHAEFAGGWRFHDTLSSRAVPYVGGGIVQLRYKETSDFADVSDNTDETFTGYVVLGGVDVKLLKWLMAGVEAQWRTIPDAIGSAGASAAFKENDLGGAVVRVLVGIRR